LEIDFDSALRRAFLTILDMAKDLLADFKKDDKEGLKNLEYKDLEVNKFCYFCLRAINKGSHEGFGTYALHYLIESLEDVGDEYKELSRILIKMQSSKKNDFYDLLKDINEATKVCYEFFYKPDKQRAVQIMSMYRDIEKRIESLLKTDHAGNEIKALIRMWHIMEILYKFPTIRLDTLKELNKGP
jgi:phosphate uptake regulator